MQGKASKASKPKQQAKSAPPPAAHCSDSDVELDDEDHGIFEEFGQRVDFLGSLSADRLAAPTHDSKKRKAASQAR